MSPEFDQFDLKNGSSKDRADHHPYEIKYTISLINKALDTLTEFKNKYDKKLNCSKLAKYLNVSESEIYELIKLILNFQKIFRNTFEQHRINKKIENNQYYLITQRIKRSINQSENSFHESKKIYLNKSEMNAFSDFTYAFKYVKRGKGFELENNENHLFQNLKNLYHDHPYLFRKNGNNLVYPSEIGLKLGELILSYNKCNKNIQKIKLENYNFIFE
jgi:hypothetical protein